MSGIVERLTEGIVDRNMRSEGHALLSKWERTGLLEGLGDDRKKGTMARLLENQAKELLRESSSMAAGDVEGFAAVAFPIVRRVFAGLVANDLVSVQPMSLPSGLIFFLDFVYSPDIGASGTLAARTGNTVDKSIYGTNQVGSEIVSGVDLVGGTYAEDFGGPRTAMGYNYSSPTGSNDANITQASITVMGAFLLDGAVTEANKKLIDYDADLLSSTDSSIGIVIMDIDEADLADARGVDYMDFDNLGAFVISDTALATLDAVADAAGADFQKQIRRLTSRIAAADATLTNKALRVVLAMAGGSLTAGNTDKSSATGIATGEFSYPLKDKLTNATALGAVVGATSWGLESNEFIPEIDIKVDSIAVTAQTKKLKAKWTPELGQDLNAYHNLDAEVELTSILSEQIALEIDREVLADLVNGATAATYYWSRSPGLFVNRVTGAEIGASSAAPDFTGTVSEWYETLVETINDVSAQIHRKTLRGGANFLVVSPEVANILEFTSGFRASVAMDDAKGSVGAVKAGSLSKKYDVIVDPYFLRNVVLVGRRGSSFLESGYVYAPYVPLQTTPTIFGPEDFVPRKGVMTRYAKKMVRPDMYGLVIVRGLIGEAGL
jgi:hypothetical protein